MGCYGVCSDDGSEGLITAHDIVVEIENLGEYFSRLSEEENSNLSMNLGLSNLGIEYSQSKFQELHSRLINELNDVLVEFKHRPTVTHWDMGCALDPIKTAVTLIIEVSTKLAASPYLILDAEIYQRQFQKALEPFSKLRGYNYLDPINISFLRGGDYSKDIHAEIEEIQGTSSSGIIRINQFCKLLEEIVASIEFRIRLLDGDRAELLANLEIINSVGSLSDSGVDFTGRNNGPWDKDSLPLDEYYEKLLYELDAIDAMYLNVDSSGSKWDDVLEHFHCLFNRDLVEYVQNYFKDSSYISYYEGLEAGLDELRNREKEYDRWYSRFEELKLNSYGF